MKVLIIAAGKGERLKGNVPKPLVKIFGLSLIERVVLAARQAGFRDFVIVLGFKGEDIRKKLGNGENYGVKITYLENKEYQRGNGLSVLAAEKLLKEKFLLLMADHLFDFHILKRLKKVNSAEEEIVLAVDKSSCNFVDLRDVTKVKLLGKKIIDIGKKLKTWDGWDCGIFLATPELFEALERNRQKGKESLTEAVKVFAQKLRAKAFDIKDNFWVDIDTKESYHQAEKLIASQVGKLSDGPIARFFNRHLSLKLSKFLTKTSLRPNFISFISFFLGLLSALFFTQGRSGFFLAGILAQTASVIDGCDGELARLKYSCTEYGAWFDAVLDRYADALIILGMIIGLWQEEKNLFLWPLGFFALLGSFMVSYSADKYDAAFGEKISLQGLRISIGRDVRLFLIMIGGISGQILPILLLLSVLGNFETLRRLFVLRKKTTIF